MENVDKIGLLEEYPRNLFVAVIAAYPRWLTARLSEISSVALVDEIPVDIVKACAQLMARDLFELLQTDVDEQRANPLQVLRDSTLAATEWLQSVGVIRAQRDEFEVSAMPNDLFAIGPLTWKDLSGDVHEAGISWGAWKAATVLTRRRQEGKIS